jgi:hypothetical protein
VGDKEGQVLRFIARIAAATMLVVVPFVLPAPALAQFNQQRHKLVGTGAAGAAGQGTSVALSADGNTVIVGGQVDNSGAGAAWVFTRNPNGVWSQQGLKLVGTGAAGAAGQGVSVALSADGNTAVVGGLFDNSNAGAVWVFARNTSGGWHQRGQKLVGTGAAGIAQQGRSVALSADGNTVIVGGQADNSFIGAAWVFNRNTNGVWHQRGQKLVGTGAVGPAAQGASVALSADGNTAIVGGPFDASNTGAAWVFNRNTNGVWRQRGQKLVGTGAAGASLQGTSVALSADGNTAIVGGPVDDSNIGAAWVFNRNTNGVWHQQGHKLVGTGAAGVAVQGISVALSADGNTAIVGGPSDDSNAGAAWVFNRNTNGVWQQRGHKLVGTGAAGAARQGTSVALSGDGNTAVAGGNADNSDAGAAWVFVARPVITNVLPLSGPVRGGTAVLIMGRNLTGTTAVNFGLSAARSFRVRDSRTIVAHTRRHRAGTVPVRVTTPVGKATRASAFTFE